MSYGWKLPEETIAAVLRDGLAFVRDAFTSGQIDELLTRVYANVADGDRAQMKRWLTDREPKIVFSYPADATALPCWAVVLSADHQVQEYLGGDGATDELADGEKVVASAERWTSVVSIIVHAESVDLCRYLYQLARFLIARGRADLDSAFPYERRLAGQDLQPVSLTGEAGGRIAFRRELAITVEADQQDASRYVPNITGIELNGTDNGEPLPI